MSSTEAPALFSSPFYTQSLFQRGERAAVADDGSLIVLPRESFWEGCKRWITFRQEPHLVPLHAKLQELMQQIQQQAGPLFTRFVKEGHQQGAKRLQCLEYNLLFLKAKLNHAGHLSLPSILLLRISNLVRRCLGLAEIKIETFAKDRSSNWHIFWKTSGFPFVGKSTLMKPSFQLDLAPLKKQALTLTEEDRSSSRFSVEGTIPDIKERFLELEKGLRTHFVAHTATTFIDIPNEGTHEIQWSVELTFDETVQQFFLEVHSSLRSIPRQADRFIEGVHQMEEQKRSWPLHITSKASDGQERVDSLLASFSVSKQGFRLPQKIEAFPLEAGRHYMFHDASNRLLFSLEFQKNAAI